MLELTTPTSATSLLNYADSTVEQSRYRLFRFAVVCWAAPLVAGVSVFGVWCATRWSWLMMLGILIIVGGIAASVTAPSCLPCTCEGAFG